MNFGINMALHVGSRRWDVLNHVVGEPGKWTARSITEKLVDDFPAINEARMTLTKKGLIRLGEKVGRSHLLFPTSAGVEALRRSI